MPDTRVPMRCVAMRIATVRAIGKPDEDLYVYEFLAVRESGATNRGRARGEGDAHDLRARVQDRLALHARHRMTRWRNAYARRQAAARRDRYYAAIIADADAVKPTTIGAGPLCGRCLHRHEPQLACPR